MFTNETTSFLHLAVNEALIDHEDGRPLNSDLMRDSERRHLVEVEEVCEAMQADEDAMYAEFDRAEIEDDGRLIVLRAG